MPLNVALTYNLIHEDKLYDKPIDTIAELDSPETIEAVKAAIESGGHKVILIEADETAFENLLKNKEKIDIVFNIAEGIRGESRESHIPAMLEMLGIPYVGSGPLTLAICLNKYRTKEILSFYNIPTSRFQVFHTNSDKLNGDLKFPLIAKLSSEGSSIGIGYDSVVDNENDLIKKIEYLMQTYKQSVLVEEFLQGREFTIPIIGNNPPITLPIIEVIFNGPKPINIFIPDNQLKIFEERNYKVPVQQTKPECPANVEPEFAEKLRFLAVSAYKALDCRDWCRMEIRLDKDGKPHILELNPIAGIDPTYWFPRSAKAAGISYNELLNKILNSAIQRLKLK